MISLGENFLDQRKISSRTQKAVLIDLEYSNTLLTGKLLDDG